MNLFIKKIHKSTYNLIINQCPITSNLIKFTTFTSTTFLPNISKGKNRYYSNLSSPFKMEDMDFYDSIEFSDDLNDSPIRPIVDCPPPPPAAAAAAAHPLITSARTPPIPTNVDFVKTDNDNENTHNNNVFITPKSAANTPRSPMSFVSSPASFHTTSSQIINPLVNSLHTPRRTSDLHNENESKSYGVVRNGSLVPLTDYDEYQITCNFLNKIKSLSSNDYMKCKNIDNLLNDISKTKFSIDGDLTDIVNQSTQIPFLNSPNSRFLKNKRNSIDNNNKNYDNDLELEDREKNDIVNDFRHPTTQLSKTGKISQTSTSIQEQEQQAKIKNLFDSSSTVAPHFSSSQSNQPVDINPITQVPKKKNAPKISSITDTSATKHNNQMIDEPDVIDLHTSPIKYIDNNTDAERDIKADSNTNTNTDTKSERKIATTTKSSTTTSAANLLNMPKVEQKRTFSTFNAPASTGVSENSIKLSEEQQLVLDLVLKGKNIFYTGSAGTGKTLLLKSLIKELRRKHPKGTVAVTASTGLASCNIGGQTLNSFTGIGLGNAAAGSLLRKIRGNKTSKERWLKLRVLIIDEISMVEGTVLDKLDYIAKALKKNNYPFGGIQLVFCGDFFQLPPVNKVTDAVFAFESKAWKDAIKINIKLNTVFRQKSDKEFIQMLNEVRNGKISRKSEFGFQVLNREITNVPPGITPSELYPTRREVDFANNRMLRALPGPAIEFKASDSGSITDEDHRSKILNSFLVSSTIHLKKGAQVMMIKNIDETLVNGTLGKVIDFIDPNTYMTYKSLRRGKELTEQEVDHAIECVSNEQLKDANGIIRGKKSGTPSLITNVDDLDQELDESVFSFLFKGNEVGGVEPELSESDGEAEDFENRGSILCDDYESFVEFNSALPLSNDPAKLAQASLDRKRELIKTLFSNSKARRLPLVRFNLVDGATRDVLVEPEMFSVEDEYENVLAARVQIPLMLAWSISIHKSQGQTLNYVRIDLKNIFEKGQAYVALSRATARRGLQVLNFNSKKIQTNPKVIEFYENLTSVNDALENLEKHESTSEDDKEENDKFKEILNEVEKEDTKKQMNGFQGLGRSKRNSNQKEVKDFFENPFYSSVTKEGGNNIEEPAKQKEVHFHSEDQDKRRKLDTESRINTIIGLRNNKPNTNKTTTSGIADKNNFDEHMDDFFDDFSEDEKELIAQPEPKHINVDFEEEFNRFVQNQFD